MKVGIHDLSYMNQYIKGCLASLSERKRNAKHPVFTQLIIALSTFKYKLKNFLIYGWVIFCYFGAEASEKFTNKDFLELPEAHQKFWIQGALDVLVNMATAKSQAQGQCISDWYFSDNQAHANGVILGSMEKYKEHEPAVIFIALAERECGTFRK